MCYNPRTMKKLIISALLLACLTPAIADSTWTKVVGLKTHHWNSFPLPDSPRYRYHVTAQSSVTVVFISKEAAPFISKKSDLLKSPCRSFHVFDERVSCGDFNGGRLYILDNGTSLSENPVRITRELIP
jgi:hypothetical protein